MKAERCKECGSRMQAMISGKSSSERWVTTWHCRDCNTYIPRVTPLTKKKKAIIKARLKKLLKEVDTADEQWLLDNERVAI